MSQTDIDAFVRAAEIGTLTPDGVRTAVPTMVNGRHSRNGFTALHWAVCCQRRDVVVALLADGADANVKNTHGRTSVWFSAAYITADILQLLIDGGGSVDEADKYGDTPLITLVLHHRGDVAAKLEVLLGCSQLNLDADYQGNTAEEWAVSKGHSELAAAIAEERARRKRWGVLRLMWIATVAATTVTP
jgi:ankyrin repeat protein